MNHINDNATVLDGELDTQLDLGLVSILFIDNTIL